MGHYPLGFWEAAAIISVMCVGIGCALDAYKHKLDTRLKQLMVERGMSANEIRVVIEASKKDPEEDEDEKVVASKQTPPQKPLAAHPDFA